VWFKKDGPPIGLFYSEGGLLYLYTSWVLYLGGVTTHIAVGIITASASRWGQHLGDAEGRRRDPDVEAGETREGGAGRPEPSVA